MTLSEEELKAFANRAKQARIAVSALVAPDSMSELVEKATLLAGQVLEVDHFRLVAEVRRLQRAMRTAMSDMPSDQSRGYETLSLALGEP